MSDRTSPLLTASELAASGNLSCPLQLLLAGVVGSVLALSSLRLLLPPWGLAGLHNGPVTAAAGAHNACRVGC